MSELFIHLYLDEDVHVLVADLIRARGFLATTARDMGNLAVPDPVHLAFAAREGMALVTHNRDDFELLAQEAFATGQGHAGIIIAVRRSPQELAQRLLAILNAVTADEMDNQLRYI
ncbi:MAG TPA: DUF5615 family PIN-like protein [Herpetosiphonaceae bacterium]